MRARRGARNTALLRASAAGDGEGGGRARGLLQWQIISRTTLLGGLYVLRLSHGSVGDRKLSQKYRSDPCDMPCCAPEESTLFSRRGSRRVACVGAATICGSSRTGGRRQADSTGHVLTDADLTPRHLRKGTAMPVSRRQRDGPRTVEAELDALMQWLNAKRGRVPYAQLAEAAGVAGFRVTADTLRRTVNGRMPTSKEVRDWAAGTGAETPEGGRLLERARAARVPDARKAFDAGRIVTRAELVRAMKRIRTRAGQPFLARMPASPEAALWLPASTLSAALRGERAVTADLLTAFLYRQHHTARSGPRDVPNLLGEPDVNARRARHSAVGPGRHGGRPRSRLRRPSPPGPHRSDHRRNRRSRGTDRRHHHAGKRHRMKCRSP